MNLKKIVNFVRNIENEKPVWMKITVGPTVGKAIGLKSKGSSFYLVADERIPYENIFNIPNDIKEDLRKKKPDFRGVYCSATFGHIPDILSDLQTYCDMTGQPGLTFLNGEEYNLQPQSNNAQLQKEIAKQFRNDRGM